MGDITVRVEVDSSGATSNVQVINKAIEGLEGTAKKVGDSISSSLKAGFGFAAGFTGFTSFTGFLKESLGMAVAAEKAQRQFAFAISGMGAEANNAFRELNKFNSEMKAQLGISPSVLRSMESMFSTYGMTTAEIKRTTKAVVDYTTQTGKDTESVSFALARAFAGQGTALKKLGLAYDETKTSAQAFEGALSSLENMYAGAAAAQAQSFAGQVQRLQGAFTSLKPAVGGIILDFINLVSQGNEAAQNIFAITKEINKLRIALLDLQAQSLESTIQNMKNKTEDVYSGFTGGLTKTFVNVIATQGAATKEMDKQSSTLGKLGVGFVTAAKGLAGLGDAYKTEFKLISDAYSDLNLSAKEKELDALRQRKREIMGELTGLPSRDRMKPDLSRDKGLKDQLDQFMDHLRLAAAKPFEAVEIRFDQIIKKARQLGAPMAEVIGLANDLRTKELEKLNDHFEKLIARADEFTLALQHQADTPLEAPVTKFNETMRKAAELQRELNREFDNLGKKRINILPDVERAAAALRALETAKVWDQIDSFRRSLEESIAPAVEKPAFQFISQMQQLRDMKLPTEEFDKLSQSLERAFAFNVEKSKHQIDSFRVSVESITQLPVARPFEKLVNTLETAKTLTRTMASEILPAAAAAFTQEVIQSARSLNEAMGQMQKRIAELRASGAAGAGATAAALQGQLGQLGGLSPAVFGAVKATGLPIDEIQRFAGMLKEVRGNVFVDELIAMAQAVGMLNTNSEQAAETLRKLGFSSDFLKQHLGAENIKTAGQRIQGHMADLAGGIEDAGEKFLTLGKNAMTALSGDMGNAFQQAILGSKSFGEALKAGVAQSLAALASEMAVKAIWAMANGFASLALPFGVGGKSAGFWFKSAALFAAGAAAAGGAAAALSGGGDAGGAGGGSGGGGSTRSQEPVAFRNEDLIRTQAVVVQKLDSLSKQWQTITTKPGLVVVEEALPHAGGTVLEVASREAAHSRSRGRALIGALNHDDLK